MQIKMFCRQKEWYDDILMDTVNRWILDNYNKIKVLEVILEDEDTVKVKYNSDFEKISVIKWKNGRCKECNFYWSTYKKFTRFKGLYNNQSREEIIKEILNSQELKDWVNSPYLKHKKCRKKIKK